MQPRGGTSKREAPSRIAAPDPRIGLTASKGYPAWREEAERLIEEGKDILSGRAASQAHADDEPTTGEQLMQRALSRLGETIGEDDRRIAARKARARRERATEWSRLRFAEEPGRAAAEAKPQAGTTNEVPEWAQTSQSRRVFDRDGQATIERSGVASLERWQRLKRQWNRQLEHAGEQGVHVIYTKGFENLHRLLRSMADDAYLESRICGKIGDVLRALEEARARREHVESTRDCLLDRLERRDGELGFGSSRDRRPAPDRAYYEAWRSGADNAVAAAEDILADPKAYGVHLDGMKRSGGGGLDSALSRVRKVLREDDRHIGGDHDKATQGRGRGGARRRHRSHSRRSREAQGAAPAVRGAQAQGKAPAQGPVPVLEQAHVTAGAGLPGSRRGPLERAERRHFSLR